MDWTDRIGRRVRLRDLHIVLAVAESRSMSKASKALAISHPVVSKTISDLEITLGVRLFDRGSRGVELTSYGQALLDCGVSVFDELRQGLKNIDFLRNPTSGELRIGCPEIMIAGIVPSIVEQYSKLYPGVRLHVLGMRSFHELRSRNVELVISRTPKPFLESDLVAEALFDEPFVAVAGIRSRWTGRRNLTLAQLIDEPWVLPPYDSVPGSYIADIFRAENLTPPPASITTLSVQLTTALLANGRYVGFFPRSVTTSRLGRGSLKILPVRIANKRIAADLITVRDRTVSPLAKLFIQCARQVSSPVRKGP